MKQKLAIIGSGIAGLGAAYHLKDYYDVTVIEQNKTVGGHAHTISIKEGDKLVPIDTAFMVFNKNMYPNLYNLFSELNIPIKKTEVSFGIQQKRTEREYLTSSINGMLAQRGNIFNIDHLNLMLQIIKLNKNCGSDLDSNKFANYSLKQYVNEKGFSYSLLENFLVPVCSGIWSLPPHKANEFPFEFLVRFLKNCGILGDHGNNDWYTVENGSQTYIKVLTQIIEKNIQTNRKVVYVKRQKDLDRGGVVLYFEDGTYEKYHKVVFACNAEQVLRILEDDATNLEYSLLRNFKVETNTVKLHTDESVMPKNKRAWGGWNYRVEMGRTTAIYWLNRLQQINASQNYFISINDTGLVAEDKVLKTIDREQPVFDLKAIKAQEYLPKLNQVPENEGMEKTTYFCGSYFKYGFHEDAYTSAINCSNALIGQMKYSQVEIYK
ncbi:NAD(P)/FAD-dependent oxidoreductase [Solitalea lacus]|uniref:NAD(P)/FAD-dependent oxidoreductase n=1 Tax=Solitalea lacus TaxID=2911172 RepID=UPI001EDAA1E7|nr:FAD-dependent oxidoreductase [Solitalea lacus]UKJ07769.1 FAD-dependent oxidoreductase [Solitalea lacus]